MALAPGTRLGPYEIIAPLGAGGMGEVYRGRDTRLDRPVAVKVISSQAGSAHALERFAREAKAIAALNHPHICTIHDVGEAVLDGGAGTQRGPIHYLVMEMLDGETLHHRLERGPFDVAAIVDMGLALADALTAAHARGVVHRDLKPSNIMLTARGPKILDFGLAKAVDQAGQTDAHARAIHTEVATLSAQGPLTDPGVTVGTTAYMSPEQLRGDSLDARTDLFSLGLVLYEMATGRRAFAGATSAVISAAILHDAPTAPRQLRTDLPPRLEQAILTALEKDRDVRTQSASELRAELTRITRELGPTRDRTPPSDSSNAPAIAASSRAASTTGIALPSPSSDAQLVVGLVRRHRGIALAAAALVVLAVAGIVYVTSKPSAAALSSSGPVSIANLQVEQLTTSGSAFAPGISPDGNYVVYVERGRSGDSLRVRQVVTGSNVEVLPAEPGARLIGTSVTPDGAFIDYLKRTPTATLDLWRIPFLGGSPKRLVEEIGSVVAWSPDGKQMAFVRGTLARGQTELVVAAPDGSNPRVLAVRKTPDSFWSGLIVEGAPVLAWSPDGKTIAALGAGPAKEYKNAGKVVFVDTATGSQRSIDFGPPLLGTAVGWIDSATVVFSGLDRSASPLQLWTLSYPQGAFTHLTNDVSTYAGLSLPRDRTSLVTGRSEVSLGIWAGDSSASRWDVVNANVVVRGPIGFSLSWSGGDLIHMGTIGGQIGLIRNRLPAGPAEMLAPVGGAATVSSDGSTIVFFDYDSGQRAKIDAEGRNRVELGPGITQTAIFPDGKHFVSFTPPPVTLVVGASDGRGAPSTIPAPRVQPGLPAISPDGRQIAYPMLDDTNQPATGVCDVATCTSPRTLPRLTRPKFTADGRALTYLDSATQANIWIQPLDGSAPRQLTHFADDGKTIWDYAWSTDGKRLAVARGAIANNIVLLRGFNRATH
jgi:serine/threonine protein kinase